MSCCASLATGLLDRGHAERADSNAVPTRFAPRTTSCAVPHRPANSNMSSSVTRSSTGPRRFGGRAHHCGSASRAHRSPEEDLWSSSRMTKIRGMQYGDSVRLVFTVRCQTSSRRCPEFIVEGHRSLARCCAAFIRCMAGLSGRRIAVAGCEWRLDQSIQQQLQAWIEVEAVRHGVAD